MIFKNIQYVIPAIIGICVLVLFNITFDDANAQPVSSSNATTGTVTATPTTTIPATAPKVNATTDNSTFDSFSALNQITNQTSSPNVAVQELNMTGVQTIPQDQSQDNQTSSSNFSKSGGFQLNERLLNYTNNAILALNDDNETEIQQNLVQIQDALIKAIDKPVVIIPAPAFESDSNSD